MRADQLNRVSSAALIALSLVALLTVLTGAYAALFGERSTFQQTDEGTAAHIFQLSVAAVLPVGLLFLATADWTRPLRTARPLAISAVALVVAFGTLYYFEHL
jgi:DMSO/TMAO reductase YedYZ heme-binding membrane subunit